MRPVLLVASGFLLASTLGSHAQQPAPMPSDDGGPGAMSDQAPPPPPPPGGPGVPHGPHGHGGPKGPRMMPPPPPKGFSIQLGANQALAVECGDEQMKSCLDAAQPLLKQLQDAVRTGSTTSGNGGSSSSN